LKDLTLDEHEVVKSSFFIVVTSLKKEKARKFKRTLVGKPIFGKEQITIII
jgi:hypothetical protein